MGEVRVLEVMDAAAEAQERKVGCEGDDGLIRAHKESETCDVCAPAEAQRCTCPSGDGSLRWPCPAHPAEAQLTYKGVPIGPMQTFADIERQAAAFTQAQGVRPVRPDFMAIKLLVAAGYVTEAKANEALNIAHGFGKGPLAPPSAPVGVEGFDEWYDSVDARFWNNWDACNAAFHAGKRAALAQQPAAVDGVIPEGWRVMPFTGSWKACDERWEVYSPDGSGGVVLASEVRSRDVASLLDALAAQPQGARHDQ